MVILRSQKIATHADMQTGETQKMTAEFTAMVDTVDITSPKTEMAAFIGKKAN